MSISPPPTSSQTLDPEAIPYKQRPHVYARLKILAQREFAGGGDTNAGMLLNDQAGAIWRVLTKSQRFLGTELFQELDRLESRKEYAL